MLLLCGEIKISIYKMSTLYYGTVKYQYFQRLQRAQNAAARIVCHHWWRSIVVRPPNFPYPALD